VLALLIDARPTLDPQGWTAELPPMDLFGTLLFQVAGQQLSVAATRRTLGRIEMLFGGRLPSPAELLKVPQDSLRQAGLSWRKVATLRDLAERLSDGRLDPDILSNLPDDEVIAALTTIPGIGPWTAQGVLILALRREDAVLPGDLALRKAIQGAYELDHLPSQAEVLAIAEKWRPYRSVATSYLFSAVFDGPTRRRPPPAQVEGRTTYTKGRTSMSSDNEQLIRRAYQLAEDKDVDGFVAAFTEDGTFTDESIEVVYRGPDEIGKTVEIYATAFPDMHRELYQMYSTGDIVVVQLALQGTHLGPLGLPRGTIPPTGKKMNAPCCDVFELENGKIKRFDCYPEGSVVLTQLGVIGNLDAVLGH